MKINKRVGDIAQCFIEYLPTMYEASGSTPAWSADLMAGQNINFYIKSSDFLIY